MAHFARIDENNIVIEVQTVNNAVLGNAPGMTAENVGVDFLQSIFGGNWKQTSYSGSFRKNYAGIGYTYDEVRDAFIPPKPFASWLLDENTCLWQAPVPYPNDGNKYQWNETNQTWDLLP